VAGRDTAGAEGGGAADAGAAPADVSRAWAVFLREAGPYASASLRLPPQPGAALQFQWLGPDAPHERARNRLSVQPATGRVTEDARHADRPAGSRFLASIYPLHMGSYFGLPGRVAMALAALALPAFAVTGWMLYLDRRRSARAVRAERDRFAALAPPSARGDGPPPQNTVLVAHASQSGRAERIALRTAEALQAAGVPVAVRPLASLDLEQLRHWRRMLCVASTFGDGDPPDAARRFARQLAGARGPLLPQLSCGLLALGDRHYANFCGFGQALDHGLRGLGAQALFPMVEADDGDPDALARWSRQVGTLTGRELDLGPVARALPPAPGAWRLARRARCNPGSEGGPLFAVDFAVADGREGGAREEGAAADWRPGALAEVWPRQPAAQVALVLQASGLDGSTAVRFGGGTCTLEDALSRSALPVLPSDGADASPQALADRLAPLAPRRYSVASLPGEGMLRLLVRQVRHDGGLGLGSGWLTAHAPLDGPVALRLLDNPNFAPEASDVPCLFIGNGAGFAGLRSQLQDRARRGRRRNWLLLGERRQAHDDIAAADIARWQAGGVLARVDRVFSRDQPERLYVQDRLRAEADAVRRWVVADGAAVYVCGSLDGMAGGVDAALRDILGADGLDDLVAAGRYRRDVY
jgi:sulfite reductase (NADPH) flavoprotein alpha-component